MKVYDLSDDQILTVKQVSARLKKGESFAAICDQYGIDLKTYYKWRKSYDKIVKEKSDKVKSRRKVYDPRRSEEKIKNCYLGGIGEPRKLKNIHLNAWIYYWGKRRDSQVTEREVFLEFLEITQKEAYFLSDCWTEEQESDGKQHEDKFLMTISNAARNGALDTVNLKGFHLVTDEGVKRIIQTLIDVIEDGKSTQLQKDDIYIFLKKIRAAIIYRGKKSWDAIGYYQYFQWRDSDDILGHEIKQLSKDFDLEREGLEGLLKVFGYHVGKSSLLTPHKRIRILGSLFEGNLGNYKVGLEDGWGSACSAERLKKITYSIANFARSKKDIPKDYRQAINDWQDDLDFLKEKYYIGFFDRDFDYARI